MSEDALEALDNESVDLNFDAEASESVDLTFDAEASGRMDEDDVDKRFCEDIVLLSDSDQRNSLDIFYHFNWKSFLS